MALVGSSGCGKSTSVALIDPVPLCSVMNSTFITYQLEVPFLFGVLGTFICFVCHLVLPFVISLEIFKEAEFFSSEKFLQFTVSALYCHISEKGPFTVRSSFKKWCDVIYNEKVPRKVLPEKLSSVFYYHLQ